jgi:hypothetical protein
MLERVSALGAAPPGAWRSGSNLTGHTPQRATPTYTTCWAATTNELRPLSRRLFANSIAICYGRLKNKLFEIAENAVEATKGSAMDSATESRKPLPTVTPAKIRVTRSPGSVTSY